MTQGKESEDHREWREEYEQRQAVYARVSALAEQLLLAHSQLDANDCITRARDLVLRLGTLEPTREDEPPFSDEPEAEPNGGPPVDPTAVLVMTPPKTNPGFWPR